LAGTRRIRRFDPDQYPDHALAKSAHALKNEARRMPGNGGAGTVKKQQETIIDNLARIRVFIPTFGIHPPNSFNRNN
jgi:hypothetical protein